MFLNLRNQKTYKERRYINDESLYKKLHRFRKDHVEWIASHILGENTETRGCALTSIQKLEVTLRYLSDPGFQISVGNEVGIHQTSVSRTVKFVLDKLIDVSSEWITFPTSQESQNLSKQEWYNRLGFPSTISAIDCTHVRINKPKGAYGYEFIYRKGFPSINVQATCSVNHVFTSVDCHWPGSVHDNRILKNSSLYTYFIRNPTTSVLLGDDGYGILPFLMTPFKNPTTEGEIKYNKLHTKNRVVIEQAFGQLKRRFPILRYGIRLNIEMVPKCIIACIVLHNISKFLNDHEYDIEDEIEDENNQQQDMDPPEYEDLRVAGQRRRNEIVHTLLLYRA